MLHTIIKQNTYMDSVELMRLSKRLDKIPGVEKATVMMGTPANLDIMRKGGFGSEKLADAKPNDMVIVADAQSQEALDAVRKAVTDAAGGQGKAAAAMGQDMHTLHSWSAVAQLREDYNVCLISVPGEYAAAEAMQALNQGRHVLLFSDNVSEADERMLKQTAHEKGLLVMGPDCGTSILSGVSLAFANTLRRGNIGIAGAAGTGIQEVSTGIDRLGGGVSHAIGTGGRDLHAAIGGVTMQDAISILAHDPQTAVIVVVSKPASADVEAGLVQVLAGLHKPCVALFLGQKGREATGRVHFAGNLTQAAQMAVELAGVAAPAAAAVQPPAPRFSQRPKVVGLYAGGTLASEALCLVRETVDLSDATPKEGYLLASGACDILDLGDDLYTKGKPHPMMDGSARAEKMRAIVGAMQGPAAVLLDVVLGFGAAADPATELAESIRALIAQKAAQGSEVAFFVDLVGTAADPQNLEAQARVLRSAGAYVYRSNCEAVEAALLAAGYPAPSHALLPAQPLPPAKPLAAPSRAMMRLVEQAPAVVNVGLQGFAKDLQAQRAKVAHFAWKPVAGGDHRVQRALAFLQGHCFADGPYRNIEEANQAVIDKVTASQPFLMDVVPACSATDVFNHGKLLLHAGPPMTWQDMSHPMQGSCVGAVLFEEWAKTEEEAWRMLREGQVALMPCHHAGFVGPMGGITSAHMPVLQVKNKTGGNTAYCTMNEGIGQVLRFGAYGPEVIARLRFMRDVLGPVLSKALHTLADGLNINVMVSRAIAMGDEFHQRNIAASLVFLKEMAPLVVALDIPNEDKRRVIQFLADTDQFFLNIMMAAAKSTMDYAASVHSGTVVTVMSRNGKDFGVRMSGTGQTWYTGPVHTPHGLYFAGFDESMANPDMGDSAITETFGVGGMAMIAAPAVTRFVGTGGFYDALEISNRMSEITISHNGAFAIPTWNFQGTCLGIDVRKVVETGITPVINTGIAHKVAGQGQIGAGTVHPPMACFTKALLAYARELGFDE